MQLSAPNSGAYAGILFMQDRTCCSTSMPYESVQGRSSAKFEGALYFPRSVLQFAGNPSMSTARYTIIVARQFNMVGTSNMNVDFSLVAGGNPVKQVALIE